MNQSIRLAAIVAFCLLTFSVLGLNDFSGFTDAGIHYAFAEELARFLRWPLPAATSLAAMSHYPPAAHVLSLFIGWFTGSTLSGIFFVTAVSFILVYVVVAEFMRHESLTDTFVAYLAFILMALVCRSGRFLEGNEIVANFFFAQFAGTAGLLAGFWILSRLKSQPFLIWLPAAAVATHFVGWIYTVNAIELALSCVMLQFLEFLHVRSRQSAARVFISAVILGAASVVHPTIIGAIGIAGNDGGISISATTSMISFVSLLIGTLALTISPLRSKLIHLDAVIALSLGVLAACSLQAVALVAFKIGSAYAIKKYGFLTGTMSILIFACLVSQHAPVRLLAFVRRLPEAVPIVSMALFGIASLLTITAFRAKTPVRELVRYDREVKDFLIYNRVADLEGNTISWNAKVTPHVNYTIGFAILRPLGAATDQLAVLVRASRLSGAARYVLVDVDSQNDSQNDAACTVAAGVTLKVVRAECRIQPPS